MLLRDYHAPPSSAGPSLPRRCRRRLPNVRGHNMAKGGLEAACWDLAARLANEPLWKTIGAGARREIPCGVSIGIQDSIPQLLDKIAPNSRPATSASRSRSNPAGTSTSSAKSARIPGYPLMGDANSAYTLADIDHLRPWTSST
jgi:o-succinylbenzoate synthase